MATTACAPGFGRRRWRHRTAALANSPRATPDQKGTAGARGDPAVKTTRAQRRRKEEKEEITQRPGRTPVPEDASVSHEQLHWGAEGERGQGERRGESGLRADHRRQDVGWAGRPVWPDGPAVQSGVEDSAETGQGVGWARAALTGRTARRPDGATAQFYPGTSQNSG